MKVASRIVLLLLGLLVLELPAALAISLTEYTFPTSTSQDAYLNGTFNLNGSSKDSTQTGYNFGGAAQYNLYYRSLPFTYQTNFNGKLLLGSWIGRRRQG